MGLLEANLRKTEPTERAGISSRSGSKRSSCAHCGLPVPADATHLDFCCAGCEAVHGLLQDPELAAFYDLGGGQPVGSVPVPSSRGWLAELVEQGRMGPQIRLSLDVQGVHCAACVWLLDRLWQRRSGARHFALNPARGRLDLVYDEGFDVEDYLDEIERLGYRVAPPSGRRSGADRGLLIRTGVCVALAMNTMLFALAGYLGMTEADGVAFTWFRVLSMAFATAAVIVGGPVFFRGALGALRRRVLHLDLPISIGIALAYGASAVCYLSGVGESYFDTVTVFVALMLVGRYLQHRALVRNRDYLLANDGAEHLRVRRREGDRLTTVPVVDVRPGDRLWLAPGDLVPVRGVVQEPAEFSLDWINGESEARSFEAFETVPAGAFSAAARPVEIRAEADVVDSGLMRWLAEPQRDAAHDEGGSRFWAWLNRGYVVGVLAMAGAAGGLWAWLDPGRAVEIATSVLVVTCPCAFGLAVPLAFELAVSGLRRRGVFVRSMGLLERAVHVRKVVFDKTGTLTWGHPRASVLREPTGRDVDVLFTMVNGSNHPVSAAIARTLPAGARLVDGLALEEVPGRGIVGRIDGLEYRLGAPSFVFQEPTRQGDGSCVFARDGHVEGCFALEEDLRGGAAAEIASLQARGTEVHLLSGDRAERVAAMAARVGIPDEFVGGALSPDDKARIVAELDHHDTMMIGDGLNDAPAFEAAWCAGTPAVDSPVMPARADFFFRSSAGAALSVLTAAAHLRRTIVAVLVLALIYNAGALAVCFAGWMTPLLAAAIMPASSLLILGFTRWRMRARRDP